MEQTVTNLVTRDTGTGSCNQGHELRDPSDRGRTSSILRDCLFNQLSSLPVSHWRGADSELTSVVQQMNHKNELVGRKKTVH